MVFRIEFRFYFGCGTTLIVELEEQTWCVPKWDKVVVDGHGSVFFSVSHLRKFLEK